MSQLPVVQVRLLGELGLLVESQPINLPRSRKSRAVLAYIAASSSPVSKSKLCDLFFSTTANPKGNLRWALSQLRKTTSGRIDNFICSDSHSVWLNPLSAEVDVHRLEGFAKSNALNTDDLNFLNDTNIHPFLDSLDLSASSDFQTWRATHQVHYDRTREQIFECHIKKSMGSLEAIKLAHLFTEQAPHLEKSWYMLVEALRKANQDTEAKAFLKIAHERLNTGTVMHEGLLALVGNKLKKKIINEQPKPTAITREQPKNTTILRLMVCPVDGDSLHKSAVFSAIFAAAASNKSFATYAQAAQETSSFEPDYKLQATFNKVDGGAKLDVVLSETLQSRGICTWSRFFSECSQGELLNNVQRWLSIRFEMDINLCLVEKAQNTHPEKRTAQDLFYLALPEIYTPVGYSVHRALEKLRAALRLNANFGPALCLAAWVKSTHPLYNQENSSRKAIASMARRSLELDYSNPLVLSWSAIVLGHIEVNANVGLVFARRAKGINSFSPAANLAMAILTHYTGDYETSIGFLDEVVMEDLEPITFMFMSCYAMNYYQLGDTSNAIESARQAVIRNPGYIVGLRILTASLVEAGELSEAKLLAKKMRELDESDYLEHLSEYLPYADKQPLDRLCKHLSLAGVPRHPH